MSRDGFFFSRSATHGSESCDAVCFYDDVVGSEIGIRVPVSAREMIRRHASGECYFREHDLSVSRLGVQRLPHFHNAGTHEKMRASTSRAERDS